MVAKAVDAGGLVRLHFRPDVEDEGSILQLFTMPLQGLSTIFFEIIRAVPGRISNVSRG